jgi:uncharacterized membrane protein
MGMKLEKTIEIIAPQAKVWAALVDIQNWPLWSESMTKIERLGDGPFGMGSQVRITQPKVPALTWKSSSSSRASHSPSRRRRAG